MAVIDGNKMVQEDLLAAARAGASAALTAKTIAGTPVQTVILTGKDVLPLIEILEALGKVNTFIRTDAVVGRKAYDEGIPIIELLIGAEGTRSELGWNCGACGFNSCEEFNRASKKSRSRGIMALGPNCNWKALDFGIASTSAAAAIAAMNIECRVQGTYGVAAGLLGHLGSCSLSIGITLGPVKASVWFNRVDLKDSFTLAEHEQFIKNTLPQLFVAFCGSGHPQIKHRPDWAAEPKFWKETADPEFMAKQQEVFAKVGKIIERESTKGAKKQPK